MYWIVSTDKGDFEDSKLRDTLNQVLDDCIENQEPAFINDIYAILNCNDEDKERLLPTSWINKIQYGVDDEYKKRLKEYKEDLKAQKELESEYREGRL